MPDSTPSTGDRTVVVPRHGVLTYLSLALNALVLLLILIGIAFHPHGPRPDGFGGERERMGPFHHDWASREGGDDFRHEGGPMQGWGHREGFGNPGFGGGPGCGGLGGGEERFGMGGPRPDFGMEGPSSWGGGHPGFAGGPGSAFGGGDFGMPKTPPAAEAMTDRFMLMLTQKLALTDQESAQIRPVVQGGIQQFQKDMEAQKQAHQKMIDDAKTKVRAVLTPDQQKQFDDLAAHLGPPPAPQ